MDDIFNKYMSSFEKHWMGFIENGGVQYILGPRELKEIIVELSFREKLLGLFESQVPISNLKLFGLSMNAFFIYEPESGGFCEECFSDGTVLLIIDPFEVDTDSVVLMPSIDFYYAKGIMPDSELFKNFLPVPVTPWVDYSYCPICNKFYQVTYDDMTGIVIGNKVVEV